MTKTTSLKTTTIILLFLLDFVDLDFGEGSTDQVNIYNIAHFKCYLMWEPIFMVHVMEVSQENK